MSELICDNCKAVFAGSLKPPAYEVASRLALLMDCGACDAETQRTSEYSPGIVLSDEQLAACACHPNQLLEDGSLSINIVDAAYLHGMSVTRVAHNDGGEPAVQAFCASTFPGGTRKNKPLKEAAGIAIFRSGDAREICHEDGSRAYKVYDTAHSKIPAHADVVATNYFGYLEDLPPDSQAIRAEAQLALVSKMELKLR